MLKEISCGMRRQQRDYVTIGNKQVSYARLHFDLVQEPAPTQDTSPHHREWGGQILGRLGGARLNRIAQLLLYILP